MTKTLSPIQKEIMDYMTEFSTTTDDWYTVYSLFLGLRGVEIKETKTEKEYDQHGRLLWEYEVDDSWTDVPHGREYRKQYLPFYQAIKTLEKKGLIKVRQATESEREENRKQFIDSKFVVALTTIES